MTLTASKYELAMRCVGAFTLPWRNERNEYSDAGSERAAKNENAINAGAIPDELRDRWPDHQWRAEVAYAFDIATGGAREIGVGIGRAYGQLAPFERAGTADAEGWEPRSRHLVIVDDKSYDEVTAPAENPQLRFLALAASRIRGATRVEVGISHLLHGLTVAELDAFDLDAIPHQLRETEMAIARARSMVRDGLEVPFSVGRWCRWCPAFDACPRQKDLRELVSRPPDDPELAFSTTLLDESDAPDVYQLWKRIGILHKRIGQSLFAYARNRPIPLPSGKAFGRVIKQGNEKLDGDIAYDVIRELTNQDTADRAVSRSATKAGIKRALAGGAVIMEDVLIRIRKRGGSRRDEKEAIEEYADQATDERALSPGERREDVDPANHKKEAPPSGSDP